MPERDLSKRVLDLVRLAESTPGWRVELTRRSHKFKFFSPDGRLRSVANGGPSDYRQIKNVTSQLRKAGLAIPH